MSVKLNFYDFHTVLWYVSARANAKNPLPQSHCSLPTSSSSKNQGATKETKKEISLLLRSPVLRWVMWITWLSGSFQAVFSPSFNEMNCYDYLWLLCTLYSKKEATTTTKYKPKNKPLLWIDVEILQSLSVTSDFA